MSMLSAQCDELREMAGQLQEHGTFVGFGGTTNTDPLMHGAAIVMREAADTIWELRDMVHKERAEADRLREGRDHWHVEQVHAYGNWEDAHKRAIELEKQNAKLRELCKELLDLCYDAYNQEWGWDDDWALAYEQAKKLGVNDV